ANTYDSLAAVKRLVYDERAVTAEELLGALRDNFAGHEDLRQRLQRCPHYGNDDPYVDDLAVEVSTHVFSEFMGQTPWRGGRFLASCLMFVTYGTFGAQVGATPDGRLAQTPVADSAGAVQGRDTSGPTALLRSVAKVPHFLAPGTLVINIRFTRRLFDDPAMRNQLKALIRTYFELRGMQLQVNVVDQRVLQAALDDPDAHRDLIVRVGGYSEYFHLLSRDLQVSILERVEHEG
ncbi:MAG: formate C-acetyltransferase/glycerol dehydratase family glycyl radical enzyme, partial [Armatimonadetes bacterium]|nr:formate C-acetyltransferase/glycerol dehydratase family glycyl radical enzyme [Armatimonadota bacterium]